MGLYLNSKKAALLYRKEASAVYFVDKTKMLDELVGFLETGEDASIRPITGNPYICVTRPRRFGKTVMANMIASYLGKGTDSSDIFEGLEVSSRRWYERHRNKHNVVYITFNELPKDCRTYREYISRIERILFNDLRREFPNAEVDYEMAVWDALNRILEMEEDVKFTFVLDEWDFIFHRDFVTDHDKREYISFLSNLLKDQPYVELAYMTGILPIAKYSSGSELNMFLEYTMVSEAKYSEYFGFTDAEVNELYARYIKHTEEPKIGREGLRRWYDGYHTMSGKRVYNPRSVVAALTNNNLGNYWTSSGPYDEIFYYIKKNIDDVKDALALMAAGEAVPAKVREYAAASMDLTTKDEIFSAMVVYGFLTSEKGKVFIPNKELMDKFEDMLLKEPSLGYVYRLAKESDRMLKATLLEDTNTMLEILEYAHNEDCIILELKVDRTPDEAIRQIKDRRYSLKFRGKLGERPEYTGRILVVGIAYDKASKKHSCKIEELWE